MLSDRVRLVDYQLGEIIVDLIVLVRRNQLLLQGHNVLCMRLRI